MRSVLHSLQKMPPQARQWWRLHEHKRVQQHSCARGDRGARTVA
jgi:hypothetical protein